MSLEGLFPLWEWRSNKAVGESLGQLLPRKLLPPSDKAAGEVLRSEMVPNDCTIDGESTIRCTMFVDITTYFPHYLLCSTPSGDLPGDTMYNRLPALLYLAILLPTIRSTDFPLCPVWRYATPDYPMCSTLYVDSTAIYPIYRLSALI
jgi:hypothetical protein